MANKFKSSVKTARGGAVAPSRSSSLPSSLKEVIFVRSGQQTAQSPSRRVRVASPATRARFNREAAIEEEADDVIDLGAPRRLRQASATSAPSPAARRAQPPNPRLSVPVEPRSLRPSVPRPALTPPPARRYPGPKPKPKPKPRPRRHTDASRTRRGKRSQLRPVPNSRLYRPAPPRPPAPPPPPARPRAAWPPPAPPRALDTASRAALRLACPRPLSPAPAPAPASARRLVVTLPAAAARYRPASEHFRSRAGSGESTPPAASLRPRAMEPAGRQSASPEDRSDGNETLSAPSEFLAEFLSAIMRRQYAEALKYCRLILQYEPHNATARGFYPLLRHKMARAQRTEEAAAEGADSSSDEAGAGADQHSAEDSPSRQEELMEHSAESEGESEASAAGDHSELELDSSDALHSSPSLSLSRRTDSASGASGASAGCWESTGSASRSDPDPDDNGNAAPTALTPALAHDVQLLPDDLENDNAGGAAGAGGGEPHHSTRLKSESVSSLRRLRAQFACSIK